MTLTRREKSFAIIKLVEFLKVMKTCNLSVLLKKSVNGFQANNYFFYQKGIKIINFIIF